MTEQLKVAIVGASGYTGEELIRLVLAHPRLCLAAVTSRQQAGQLLNDRYPAAPSGLAFQDLDAAALSKLADVFFLALPHGESRKFAEPLLDSGKTVLDLSADFRIKDREVFQRYYSYEAPDDALLQRAAYGQPETNRAALKGAKLIACPGCYPTSIILPLAPLLAAKIIDPDHIIINSMSGVSGAGRKAEIDLLYCECNESARAYGGTTHRHIPEIEQELTRLAECRTTVQFTPHLLPITRGMLTTIVARPAKNIPLPDTDTLLAEFREFYRNSPFVRVLASGKMPRIADVARTNRCDLSALADPRTGNILLYSAIDNLTKGAGGQALQCLNIMRGWPESEGLPQ